MKDQIFSEGDFSSGSFKFTSDVASVFDDMASRCIPFYREVIQLTAEVAQDYVPNGGHIYDLGCSTGTTLLYLAKCLNGKNISMTGYDPAEAMLKKANEKSHVYTYSHEINFLNGVCESASIKQANMVIMNYTLQFIELEERAKAISRIYENLEQGGVFLISEKLREKDPKVEKLNTRAYESFKAGNGYSFLEIANKRQALENILVPQSTDENIAMLKNAGFSTVDVLFKWLNFATFIAIK
jgi:tRNA (cmo5U34)-methyltransferase